MEDHERRACLFILLPSSVDNVIFQTLTINLKLQPTSQSDFSPTTAGLASYLFDESFYRSDQCIKILCRDYLLLMVARQLDLKGSAHQDLQEKNQIIHKKFRVEILDEFVSGTGLESQSLYDSS